MNIGKSQYQVNHGMYSLMPSLCPHKISQLGGIDEINDKHELPALKKRTVTSINNN